jgi:hypothetical protein
MAVRESLQFTLRLFVKSMGRPAARLGCGIWSPSRLNIFPWHLAHGECAPKLRFRERPDEPVFGARAQGARAHWGDDNARFFQLPGLRFPLGSEKGLPPLRKGTAPSKALLICRATLSDAGRCRTCFPSLKCPGPLPVWPTDGASITSATAERRIFARPLRCGLIPYHSKAVGYPVKTIRPPPPASAGRPLANRRGTTAWARPG